MKIFSCILWIAFSVFYNTSAQSHIGIIKDVDGYTLVRESAGLQTKVKDTLYNGDFFEFYATDTTNWFYVQTWKNKNISGFVHKSRIQPVEELSEQYQKDLIEKTLKNYKDLREKANKSLATKNQILIKESFQKAAFYSDSRYNYVLEFIPEYFKNTKDIELLHLFIQTMIADSSSANELTSDAIAMCFIHNPNMVYKSVMRIQAVEHRKQIVDHILFGLSNYSALTVTNSISKKELVKYKNLLNRL